MNAAPEIEVHVNEQPRRLTGPVLLVGLLQELGLAERRGIAIAIGGEVVPRSAWSTRQLVGGERLLVIQATQGG